MATEGSVETVLAGFSGRLLFVIVATAAAISAMPCRAADQLICQYLSQKVVWTLVVEPRGLEPASTRREGEQTNRSVADGSSIPWIERYRAAGCSSQGLIEDLLRAEQIVVDALAAAR